MDTETRRRRIALGLSQAALARLADVSQPTVSQVESGYRPGAETRRRIAAALGAEEAVLWPEADARSLT